MLKSDFRPAAVLGTGSTVCSCNDFLTMVLRGGGRGGRGGRLGQLRAWLRFWGFARIV